MAEIENTPEATQSQLPDAALEARRLASEYLHRWPGAPDLECPICHHHDWGISDPGLLTVRTESPFFPPDPQRAYPLVPIGCATCGYTYFINEKWVRFGGPPPDLEIERGIEP